MAKPRGTIKRFRDNGKCRYGQKDHGAWRSILVHAPISDASPRRPRREALEFCKNRSPGKRGRRESRVANAPAVSRANLGEAHERSHHRFTGISRPSLRNGFNGLFRALPGAWLPPTTSDIPGSMCFSVILAGLREDHMPLQPRAQAAAALRQIA